jgi:coenzyme F420 hydrogenase subunit beta
MWGHWVESKKGTLIAYNDLEEKIIKPGFCTLCGACEAACPVHAIKIENDEVHQVHDCSEDLDLCPICYDVCPHSEALLLESMGFVADAPIRREGLGYYRKMLLAQAADSKLRELSRGGAVVTSLLTYGIENNVVDSAIVSQAETQIPVKPKPLVGLVPDDILSAVGSKFFPASVARAFGSAVYEYGKVNIAFVGVPCHVLALRKLEAWQHKITANLKIIIGLFCFGTLSLGLLLKYMSTAYRIKPSEIKRIDLNKEWVVQTEGGDTRIPLSEVKQHILPSCRTCTDFTCELADISVGGAYPLNGWSTVIIRTKSGEDFFYDAVEHGVINTGVIEYEPDVVAHVIEVAVQKRTSALKELSEMKEAYVPLPVRPLREIAVLSQITVEDVMTRDVLSVSPNITISHFLDFMAKHHHIGYPVTDERGDLVGIVTLEDAAKVAKERRDKILIGDIAKRKLVVVYPEELALAAFKRMSTHEIGRIPVVDRKNPKKLLGILTKTDLMHILRKRL